jgi:hypothetical protein
MKIKDIGYIIMFLIAAVCIFAFFKVSSRCEKLGGTYVKTALSYKCFASSSVIEI